MDDHAGEQVPLLQTKALTKSFGSVHGALER